MSRIQQNNGNIRKMGNRRRGAKRRKNSTPNRFSITMQKKLVVLFGLILLAFVGLSAMLIYIYRTDSDEYKKQVLSQQEYDSKVLPYKRGDIVDAKGSKLAYCEKVYNLAIDPKRIGESEEILSATMRALTSCFEINEMELRQYIKENPSRRYYIVLKQLAYDQISQFLDIQNDTKNNPDVKGVWFEEEYKRVYPFGSLACDVIGFTSKDNVGTYGLEEYYNDTLNGTNGREFGYLNDDSTLERTTKAAVDGNTIICSIDSNIQKIVEKHILAFNELHKGEYRKDDLGSKNTGVIVMNPKTGEILAMASYPTFDLNNPTDLSAYYSQEEIVQMQENETFYDTLNQLWRNFCIQDTYEPGSTAKALTISAGLDSGKITGNESYDCHGVLEVSGHGIHCHKLVGHGILDVSGTLEQSCNVGLMRIAATMGNETFMKYLTNYNIGLKTNIDLAGEARTANLIFETDKMVASDLAIASFGQGYNLTMIQLASAFSAVINGGYYYEPHVVTEIKNSEGVTVQKNEPRVLKQVISNEVSETMRQYLTAVCTEGTGTVAVPSGYIIGGKTGTAEKYPRNQGNYVVSFIGFAPVDDPEVVVYAVVDEPNVDHQPHSSFAQEIVKGIFTEILPYMNIFRTEELSEEEIEELKQLNIIPSISENTVEEQKEELESDDEEESQEDEIQYEKDPETGNLIDPVSGQQIDPETYEFVDPTFSLFE